MAHGLRAIVNSGYFPYGSGRDWFFIGDALYRNGRLAPDPNHRFGKTDPTRRRRGVPSEIRMSKAILGAAETSISKSASSPSFSSRRMSSLRRQQSAPTCNDAIQSRSTTGVHVDRWKDQNSSKRLLKAKVSLRRSTTDTEWSGPGMAKSSYEELGQIEGYIPSDVGAQEKYRYFSSRVFPPTKVDQKPEKSEPASEWGVPEKHLHFSGKFFPRIEKEPVERQPGWRPPEYGMPDKHRFHQPPIWAPKDALGLSRVPSGKACEIPQR